MRPVLLQIFSKNTLKNMALKIVHYALIALAIAICIVYLYWRWRKVNNQNKALEAELRLVQPYNNMPAPEVVQMRPTLQFQPVDLAAVTKSNIAVTPAVVSPPSVLNKSPPVLTPTASTIDEESDEDEEENVGSPPMVPEVILPPATITVVAISNNRDPVVADSNFTADVTPGITELTDITATSEDEGAQESIIEDKPAPSKTTRRRRK